MFPHARATFLWVNLKFLIENLFFEHLFLRMSEITSLSVVQMSTVYTPTYESNYVPYTLCIPVGLIMKHVCNCLSMMVDFIFQYDCG